MINQISFLAINYINKFKCILCICCAFLFFSLTGFAQNQKKKFKPEKSTLVDPAVKKLTRKKYKIARPLSCNRAAVMYKNKWGFINEQGAEVIPTMFDLVYDFNGRSTIVKKQNTWHLLSSNNFIIKNLDADFVSAFYNGKARVVKENKYGSIDFDGNLTPDGWRIVNTTSLRYYNQTNDVNINCPQNFDFELGDFTNWSCDTGSVKSTTDSAGNGIFQSGVWGATSTPTISSNEIVSSPSIPLANRHEIISRAANRIDPYGLFSLAPPDGSNNCIKLGSDQNDPYGSPSTLPGAAPSAKTESVEYTINVSSPDLCFFYDYALVLMDPTPTSNSGTPHNYYEKPRAIIEITDLNTNALVPCGRIEYVADSTLPSFFQSAIRGSDGSVIWCKPWTKAFVNLSKYFNHTLKVKFTTTDCSIGGHWGYGYLDIEGCQVGATAKSSCASNSQTVLDGPSGFISYNWWNSNYTSIIGTGQHAIVNTGLSAGATVHLEITPNPNAITNEVCKDTLNVVVQQPALSFNAGPDKTICSGDKVTIGSGGNINCTYAWRPNNSTLSSNNLPQVFAYPTTTTEYIIHITDTATNCFTEDTVKVFVNPSPNLSISLSSLCFNQNGSYGPIKLSGADSYTWAADTTNTLNIFNSNNDSATITNLHDSMTRYHVTAYNTGTNCSVDTNINLIIYPLPIVGFNYQSPQCLLGNQFVFSSGSFFNPGSNSTVTSNAWIINNGSPILGADIIFNFPIVGRFPIKLISTSDHGCSDISYDTVEVYPTPRGDFIPPLPQCASFNSFTFDTIPANPFGGSISDVKWNFGDGVSKDTTPVIHSYITPGEYNVQLIVTSDKGCKYDTTKKVKVFPMPSAYFAFPDSKCLLNNSYQFTSQSTAVSPGRITYNVWNFGGGIGDTLSGTTVSHAYQSDGNYKVKLVSTSNEGCKDSAEQQLSIYPMPNADFAVPPIACFLNNNYLFTSTSTIITSQNPIFAGRIDSCFWNFGILKDTFGISVRHEFTNPNVISYPIRLIAQTNHYCRDTTFRTINFLASPIVSIDPGVPLSICSGDSIRLHATAQTLTGSITNYQWSMGSTDIPGATTPNLIVNTSGVYQITVTNTNNCTNTSADDRVVVHPLPLGNVVLPNKDYICEFGNMLLNCTSNGTSYQWYLNGVAIPGAITSSYLAVLPGIYAVKLISTFGCENYASGRIALSLRKKPAADFSFPSFCKLEPILFNNLSNVSSSGPINWLWDFGDSTTSTLFSPTHTYQQEGNLSATLTATSVDCPSLISQSQQIVPIAKPIPGLRYPTVTALKNNNTYLQARTFANSYLWSPSTGINNPNIQNPIYYYDQNVEYLIRLQNISGCITVDSLLVRVYENADVQVPTGFSPNADGHNDYLDVFLIGVTLKHFWVFNRWGQLLFETTNPKQKWDGTFKGKKQPAETYVWQAEVTDNLGINIIKRGQTILIR